MDKILFEQVPDLFSSIGNLFVEKKEELCEMDARLGDGDLGLTMSKGYGSLPDIMREESAGAAGDIGKLLMKSGMKMSSLVPSTMGFLMSTGIMDDAGVDARGRGPASGLRPRRQEPRPADQHHHGPDGHSGRHLRRRPQPQYLLT